MANSIFKNNELILRCSNGLLEVLYGQLVELLKIEDINNANIVALVKALDQEQVGRGFVQIDISDFLKTSADYHLFAGLVKLAIDNAVTAKMFTSFIEQNVREFQKKIDAPTN